MERGNTDSDGTGRMRSREPQEQTVFGGVKDLRTWGDEDMQCKHQHGFVAVVVQPLVVHLIGGETLLQGCGNVMEIEGSSVQVLPVHEVLFREAGLLAKGTRILHLGFERSCRLSRGRERDSFGCSCQ